MPDPKPVKSDAMKDLKWILLMLLILFLVWLGMGGRARKAENTSPFLVPTPSQSLQ